MLRRTNRLLVFVLLCTVGPVGVFLNADEPVKTGEKRDTLLYIRTDPPGAKVLINGKEVGTSDGLFHVEPGKGTILVELEGRQPDKRQVIVRANAITRVELSLEPKAEPLAEDQGPHFVAQLPQGTVELVAITNYPPTEKSQWWKPDGSPVDAGPFLARPTSWSLASGKKPLAFMLRFKNLPADASHPAWKIEPTTGNWGSTAVLDAHGKTVADAIMFCAELGKSAAKADFRVGASTGAWETVISQNADHLGSSSFSRDGGQWTVTFEEATAGPLPGVTQVNLTKTESHGPWNTRLVAVADDGSEHAALIGYRNEDGTAVFRNLPLSSIKEFRFQVRPFDWVEFKNVSLSPEQKTDVEVVSSGMAKAPEKQGAKKVTAT